MPRRSHKTFPLSESREALNLKRKEIKLYAEVSKLHGKNESSTCETGKKEKETHASFAVALQTAKVRATVCGECLVNMEKSLNLWVKEMSRK